MAIYGGNDPTNMVLKTGETIKGPGKIIGVYDTTGVTPSAANGIGIGVSVGDSTRTAAGVLQTTVGATVGVVPFGGVLYIQAVAAETWNPGALVYAQASGMAGQTSSSRKLIGVYVGEAGLVTAALVVNGAGDSGATEGTMIPVATSGALTA